jgi:hypothetical protein
MPAVEVVWSEPWYGNNSKSREFSCGESFISLERLIASCTPAIRGIFLYQGVNSFQLPSETTSTVPSTTLMAV